VAHLPLLYTAVGLHSSAKIPVSYVNPIKGATPDTNVLAPSFKIDIRNLIFYRLGGLVLALKLIELI